MSAAPALSKASEAAQRNGTPYGKLITTTPNDLDTEMGKYCKGMIDDACPFDEAWYDWDIDEIKKYIEQNSRNDFVYLVFNYKELGHDDKWYQKQCRQLNNDLLKIKREILLEWTLANDTSPFSEEQLAEIGQHAGEPIGKFYVMKRYKFEIFSEMRNIFKKSWLIGIDIGAGLNRDFTVISIIDPKDMVQKAVFRSNNISLPDLKDLVIHLVLEFCPNGVIIPERNNLGISLIQDLLRSEVANNLYYEVREVKGEKKVDDPKRSSKKTVKTKTRVYGVTTSKDSRDIMINEILSNAVNDTPHVFTSKYIFEELRTLERNKKGKIEHRDGGHDDTLFSWLVACYAFLYGNNINKFVKVISDGDNNENEENNKDRARNIHALSKINSGEKSQSEILLEMYKNESRFFEDHNENDNNIRKQKRMKSLNFITSLNR